MEPTFIFNAPLMLPLVTFGIMAYALLRSVSAKA